MNGFDTETTYPEGSRAGKEGIDPLALALQDEILRAQANAEIAETAFLTFAQANNEVLRQYESLKGAQQQAKAHAEFAKDAARKLLYRVTPLPPAFDAINAKHVTYDPQVLLDWAADHGWTWLFTLNTKEVERFARANVKEDSESPGYWRFPVGMGLPVEVRTEREIQIRAARLPKLLPTTSSVKLTVIDKQGSRHNGTLTELHDQLDNLDLTLDDIHYAETYDQADEKGHLDDIPF